MQKEIDSQTPFVIEVIQKEIDPPTPLVIEVMQKEIDPPNIFRHKQREIADL